MSWVEHTRSLIAYNEWANEKVLEAAAPYLARIAKGALGPFDRSLAMHHFHSARIVRSNSSFSCRYRWEGGSSVTLGAGMP